MSKVTGGLPIVSAPPVVVAEIVKRLLAIGGSAEIDGKNTSIEEAVTSKILTPLICLPASNEAIVHTLVHIIRGGIKHAVNAQDEDRVIKLLDLFTLLLRDNRRLLMTTLEHYLAGTDFETGLPVYGTTMYKDVDDLSASGTFALRSFIKSRLWILERITESWTPEQSAISVRALGIVVGCYGHYASHPYDKFKSETSLVEHLNIFPFPPDNSSAAEMWKRGIRDMFRKRLEASVWTSVEIGKWLEMTANDVTQDLLRMMVVAWTKKETNFNKLIPAIVEASRTSRPSTL